MSRNARRGRPAAHGTGLDDTIVVDGIEVHINRKNVRNLNLRVASDGSVNAGVPYGMSLDRVRDFVASKSDWIARQRSSAEHSIMATAESADAATVAQWRSVVEATTPPLIEAWEPILGVKAGPLAFRNMRSRWGSCQPKTGRICINVRLALFPPECLEYVVVHELCHLLVPGHGAAFHELMDRVMPDWKVRRAKLR